MVRQNVREQVFNGLVLAKARKEHGLTQEELAARIGTGASQINRYEKGDADPSLAVAKRLKEALGVPVDDFLLEDEANTSTPRVEAMNETERALLRAYRHNDLQNLLSLFGKRQTPE